MEKHAYTAGLIDGEGTITLSYIHKADKFRSPVISVSSTTHELLDFLKSTYGGSISPHKTYKQHYKQSWSWKVNYNFALKFLELVLPYMREPEKVRRGQLIVNKYKSLTSRNGKYNKTQLISKLAFEAEFFGGDVGTVVP